MDLKRATKTFFFCKLYASGAKNETKQGTLCSVDSSATTHNFILSVSVLKAAQHISVELHKMISQMQGLIVSRILHYRQNGEENWTVTDLADTAPLLKRWKKKRKNIRSVNIKCQDFSVL